MLRRVTTASFVAKDEFDLSGIDQHARKLVAWAILRLGGRRRNILDEVVTTTTILPEDKTIREYVCQAIRAAETWDANQPVALLIGEAEFSELAAEAPLHQLFSFSMDFTTFSGIRILVVPGMEGVLALSGDTVKAINNDAP
ncbi:MAG: hypothetical protein O3A14_20260 [Cyanobacteria bacterium]|nr:hypothetical protein [Cyanobacteriota bacterium]